MIDEKLLRESFDVLQKRFNSTKLLRKAAQRRAHLNYDRLSFGKLTSQKKYLQLLLSQAHSAYYLGSFHACVAVCGAILEALIQIKIIQELRKTGSISYYFYFQGQKIDGIHTLEDIEKMSFNDMINLFRQKKYLSSALYRDLCWVKDIRNHTLHNRLPLFRRGKNNYVLKFTINNRNVEIVMNKKEAEDIEDNGYQMTAYYCLSRMRGIFRSLIQENQEKP